MTVPQSTSNRPPPTKRSAVLLLGLAIAVNFGLSPAAAVAAAAADAVATAGTLLVELPNTDGYGLLPKPPAFTPEQMDTLLAEGKQACAGQCVTPFGRVLGVADGAAGRSNCVPTCIRPEYSFLDLQSGKVAVYQENPRQENLRYIGVTYQCVEYARKWWMKNKGITFGSVDSANEIIYLAAGADLHSNNTVPLARSINGTARRPPRRGDLVVYYPDRDDPEWRHGHVAVVVATDLKSGVVALAEENYDNKPWRKPRAFARQIRLFKIGGRYTLLDVPVAGNGNPDGGRIAGWIYPLTEK